MTQSKKSRRDFLKVSAASASMASIAGGLRTRPASGNVLGANDRVRVGVIGCGSQGTQGHIRNFPSQDNAQIAYVCDPDESRRKEAAQLIQGAQAVGDLRTILDDQSIDAVTIATPDHWHTPAALLALAAGKHVYVEKPCSHNLREGRLLVEAAEKSGKIVQHGTQARSNDGFRQAIQMLREGIVGDVLFAKAWNIQRRNNIGHQQPSSPPRGFDYDTWIGPAPVVPFRANCHHETWRWWYNFGTGDLGNDSVHELDMARWGLGINEHPTQVAVAGGKFFFNDDQQFPDTVSATFDYPGDGTVGDRKQLLFEMRLWTTNYPEGVDGGVEFWGTEGKMFFSRRGKFQLLAERNKKLDIQPTQTPEMNVMNNLRAWLAAIRKQEPATADAGQAHLSASLAHLANIAVRVGRSFEFDPENERILRDDEANALLTRTYRTGHWAAPAAS